MDKQYYKDSDNVNILYSFENEYWEEYILYMHGNIKTVFITWDELDWEDWYTLTPEWVVAKYFILNDSETREVKNYLDNK